MNVAVVHLAQCEDWFTSRSVEFSADQSCFGDDQLYYRPLVLRAIEEYTNVVKNEEDKREYLKLQSRKLYEMREVSNWSLLVFSDMRLFK